MRRIHLRCMLALGICVLLLFLSSCHSTRPLIIAAHPWPGYELMFLSAQEGWLPADEITLHATASVTDSLEALQQGTVDGVALTLDEVLRVRDAGIPLTVVLVFDASAGSDVVMGGKNIHDLQALIGKRIGVERNALGAYMLEMTLQMAQLKQDQVQLVYVSPDKHLDAWKDAKVDALVTYEPVATKLEQVGMTRIFDSRKVPGTIFDVLAIKPEVLRSHPTAVRNLVCGHFKALSHLRTNPQDAAYRMTTRIQLPAEKVLASFRGLELPSISANRNYIGGSTPALVQSALRMLEVMRSAGMLSGQIPLDGLVSDEFLPRDESQL